MPIPLAVRSLPWVTLGQVSKTLLTNRTHLTHEQIEATRWLFRQFNRREERHPLPLKLQGGKVVGHTVLDAQRNPGTRAGPVSILRGTAVSRGGSRDSTELSRLPDTPASASRRCRNKPPQTAPQHKKTGFLPSDVGNQGAGQRWFLRGALDRNSFPPPATPVLTSPTILLPPKALSHRLRLSKVPSC